MWGEERVVGEKSRDELIGESYYLGKYVVYYNGMCKKDNDFGYSNRGKGLQGKDNSACFLTTKEATKERNITKP